MLFWNEFFENVLLFQKAYFHSKFTFKYFPISYSAKKNISTIPQYRWQLHLILFKYIVRTFAHRCVGFISFLTTPSRLCCRAFLAHSLNAPYPHFTQVLLGFTRSGTTLRAHMCAMWISPKVGENHPISCLWYFSALFLSFYPAVNHRFVGLSFNKREGVS